ncbi:hypothetical protein PA598K_06842 [Paenibacillus sp. 598K]|uniref:hypothetical protein n=1 Tax=Paenibacillus sp. 598K TaxID=1117987 RepID=UPI000FFA1877|nr:hypothetical protein [Paenibacillus sp. 598K]GBF78226.1 hypothetical protein PA598K_06842 [Paenibacillus sp. 598K]
MERYSLPLANPPIKYLQHYAYRLSIILNHDEGWPWFYSNFIQLLGRKGATGAADYRIDFLPAALGFHTFFPLLDYSPLKKEIILNQLQCDVHDLLQRSLQEQLYIYTFVDEFYIPHRRSYQQQHFGHDILIYGYDLSERAYHVVGFDENMMYRETKVRFDQMEQAMMSAPEQPIIQIYRNQFSYELDMEAIKDALTDYIHAHNSSKRLRSFVTPMPDHHYYGLAVYSGLEEHLDMLGEDMGNYNIRLTHLLMEHKQCMLLRLDYLKKEGRLFDADELLGSYQELMDMTLKLRHLYLKISLSTDKEAPGKVKDLLLTLRAADESLSEKIVKRLKM